MKVLIVLYKNTFQRRKLLESLLIPKPQAGLLLTKEGKLPLAIHFTGTRGVQSSSYPHLI